MAHHDVQGLQDEWTGHHASLTVTSFSSLKERLHWNTMNFKTLLVEKGAYTCYQQCLSTDQLLYTSRRNQDFLGKFLPGFAQKLLLLKFTLLRIPLWLLISKGMWQLLHDSRTVSLTSIFHLAQGLALLGRQRHIGIFLYSA